jgi:hypothetical protein
MTLLLLLFILWLYVLGFGCLMFPRAVQVFALKAIARGATARSTRLRTFIQSQSYLTNVRAVGALSMLAAALLTFAALRRSG